MVSYRETPVADDVAQALLTEYFDSRVQTHPSSYGEYRLNLPVPEKFVPPNGVFLVVEGEDEHGEPADVGCGGLRRLGPGAPESEALGLVRFELKHLWLQPGVRGRGYGRALILELERRAIGFGAEQLVLDTNDSLVAARGLYLSSGFEEIAAYNDNPNATNWYGKLLN
ncbi:MAG: family N-acetyltransferase [Microbacteriaceae bacterium]|nr:family N-acetyltransferase [Microbacteriaceae bacterium]